jgi:methyl-accepting chemotaxis protein
MLTWRPALRTRLYCMTMGIFLASALLLAVGVSSTSKLAKSQETLINQQFRPVIAVLQTGSDINAARAGYLAFQNQSDVQKRQDLRAKLVQLSSDIDEALTTLNALTILDATSQKTLRDLQAVWISYRSDRDQQQIPALLSGDVGKAQRLSVEVQADRFRQLTTGISTLVTALTTQAEAAKLANSNSALTTITILIWGLVGMVVIGSISTWLVVRQVSHGIERANQALAEASQAVTNSAEHVSGQSQQMALGASRQAAALEETSASLTELLASGKSTAQGAERVDLLATQAGRDSKQGQVALRQVSTAMNQRLDELATAVQGIQATSQRMSQVVTGIDTIAVQINLLALNASVEAARAGDAGAGFAVVAEEVRNLAKRSAEEVSATADLLEANTAAVDGIRRLSLSVREDLTHKLSIHLDQVFKTLADSVGQVSTEVSTISAANREQANGMDQIGKSVQELDGVTQSNAATAQQVATSAEELNVQAIELTKIAHHLERLVHGG